MVVINQKGFAGVFAYSERAAFHCFFSVHCIRSSDHFDKRVAFIFIHDTGLDLAMAAKNRAELSLRTPVSKE